MALPINQPFPLFADRDGSPLDQGYIYIGAASTNPETAPTTVYWDSGLTLPAAQPLRTINGYIARNGTPSAVFSSLDSYAVTVKDSQNVLVVYSASVASASLASVAAAAASAAAAAASAAAAAQSEADTAAIAANVITQAELEDYLGKMKVPIGSVHAMASGNVPYGYLECNGAAISRTSYDDLFADIGVTYGNGDGVSTFNVPDLRGEFIRGWDHGRLVDSARVLGSSQADMLKSHEHSLALTGTTLGGVGNISVDRRDNNGNGTVTMASANKAIATGGTETRPRNVAMMYVIKAYDAPLQTTPPSQVVTESTASRTLALVDQSKYINCVNLAPLTITIPPSSSVDFPIGSEVHFFRSGVAVTFAPGIGVTIRSTALNIRAQYEAATVKKVATDTWHIFGALS